MPPSCVDRFQYTTTNAAGAKVVRTSTFTPSFAPTLVPAEPSSGSESCFALRLAAGGLVLTPLGPCFPARFDYSEYASIIVRPCRSSASFILEDSDSHLCAFSTGPFVVGAVRCLPGGPNGRRVQVGQPLWTGSGRSPCWRIARRCRSVVCWVGVKSSVCSFLFPLARTLPPLSSTRSSCLLSQHLTGTHAHGHPQGAAPSFFLSFHSGSLYLHPL